jgi:hypothetical protein
MKIGVNWFLKYRQALEKIEKLEFEINVMRRKYENYNSRSAWDRKNNNVVKLGRRVHKTRN